MGCAAGSCSFLGMFCNGELVRLTGIVIVIDGKMERQGGLRFTELIAFIFLVPFVKHSPTFYECET